MMAIQRPSNTGAYSPGVPHSMVQCNRVIVRSGDVCNRQYGYVLMNSVRQPPHQDSLLLQRASSS